MSRWRAWSRTTGGKPFLGPGGRPATARYLRQESRLNEENPRLAPCPDAPVVLSTHGLTKDFKDVRAVDDLDLAVCRGDVFGFLGPNGAGKTSTIRMIFGLIYPTQGHVEILGHRVPDERQEALRHVGGFVDDPVFYGNMSAHRNLRLFGGMNGPVSEERIGEVLEMVGLSTRADSKVGGYSHGMRQRLGIALALIHRPDVVVLDEPTSGLDPAGMRDVRGLVRDLATTGTPSCRRHHPGKARPAGGGVRAPAGQVGREDQDGRPGSRLGGAAVLRRRRWASRGGGIHSGLGAGRPGPRDGAPTRRRGCRCRGRYPLVRAGVGGDVPRDDGRG